MFKDASFLDHHMVPVHRILFVDHLMNQLTYLGIDIVWWDYPTLLTGGKITHHMTQSVQEYFCFCIPGLGGGVLSNTFDTISSTGTT